jgi:FKBP12-rapamycin complex-associated protein
VVENAEFSGDSRNKEESARLLGHLIRPSQRLIKPYVEPILTALLPKLKDSNPRVASCVLATLGELAIVGGEDMRPHISQLLPLIIDTLQDQSSVVKREVALRTLGQLAESAGTQHRYHLTFLPFRVPTRVPCVVGYVIEPFIKYPKLLDILINEIKTEQGSSVRQEVVKVLGILGALDPYKHKTIQMEVGKKKSDEASTGGPANPVPADSMSGMASEDYYLTVSINALMKILRDPSLSQVRYTTRARHAHAHDTTRAHTHTRTRTRHDTRDDDADLLRCCLGDSTTTRWCRR